MLGSLVIVFCGGLPIPFRYGHHTNFSRVMVRIFPWCCMFNRDPWKPDLVEHRVWELFDRSPTERTIWWECHTWVLPDHEHFRLKGDHHLMVVHLVQSFRSRQEVHKNLGSHQGMVTNAFLCHVFTTTVGLGVNLPDKLRSVFSVSIDQAFLRKSNGLKLKCWPYLDSAGDFSAVILLRDTQGLKAVQSFLH